MPTIDRLLRLRMPAMSSYAFECVVLSLPFKLGRGSGQRPSLVHKSKNEALGKGFVKMSASWLVEDTKQVSREPKATFSRTK